MSLVLYLTCAALAAQVQVDWSYTHDHPYDLGIATSALELPGGSFVIATNYGSETNIGAVGGLLPISSGGVVLPEHVLESLDYDLGANRIFAHPSGSGYQIVSAAFAKQSGQPDGFIHYRVGADLNVVSQGIVLYPHPVQAPTGWWDVTASTTGELLLVSGMFVGDPNVPTHLWLQRISADGDSLASRAYFYEPAPGEVFTNRVTSAASVGDRLWVSFRAIRPLGPDGFSKCLLFDEQFELVTDTGFALPYPYSSQTPVDSSQTALGLAISTESDVYLLESRNSSNVFAPNDPSPVRVVIAKYSSQGALLRQYQHVPNELNTLSSRRPVFLMDQSIVFAYNYGYYGPAGFDIPTSVHLLRFDPDLNLLDEFIINGEPDLAQYMVHEIVPTTDGGVLLLGMVSTSTEPSRYKPWIVKLSGVITSTGQELRPDRPKLTAFPNPGDNTVVLSLNSSPNLTGRVLVTDMLGRTIETKTFWGTQVLLESSSWQAGSYLCTVLNNAGIPISSVRWIKQ